MSAEEQTAAAFASALGALVARDIDVADVLVHLVTECRAAVGADAVALMVSEAGGGLSLLTAESHQAEQLELLQIQDESGPCVDVLTTGEALRVGSPQAVEERWGDVGATIVRAGFVAVEAYPMRWRGVTLGGLNIFFRDADVPSLPELCQAFADISTLVVVQSGTVSADHVRARVHEALSARGLLEQAKGVIAYREDLDMGAAYTALLQRAETSGIPLTQTALDVVQEASDNPQ